MDAYSTIVIGALFEPIARSGRTSPAMSSATGTLSPSAEEGIGQKPATMAKLAIIRAQTTVAVSAPRRPLRRVRPGFDDSIDLSSIWAGAQICLITAPKCKSILGFQLRHPGTRLNKARDLAVKGKRVQNGARNAARVGDGAILGRNTDGTDHANVHCMFGGRASTGGCLGFHLLWINIRDVRGPRNRLDLAFHLRLSPRLRFCTSTPVECRMHKIGRAKYGLRQDQIA